LLEGISALGKDSAKILERLSQSLKTINIPERITFVQSFDKVLFVASASGDMRIVDFGSQNERVMEKLHLSVKIISQSSLSIF
jgi:hypothetical protein